MLRLNLLILCFIVPAICGAQNYRPDSIINHTEYSYSELNYDSLYFDLPQYRIRENYLKSFVDVVLTPLAEDGIHKFYSIVFYADEDTTFAYLSLQDLSLFARQKPPGKLYGVVNNILVGDIPFNILICKFPDSMEEMIQFRKFEECAIENFFEPTGKTIRYRIKSEKIELEPNVYLANVDDPWFLAAVSDTCIIAIAAQIPKASSLTQKKYSRNPYIPLTAPE